MNKNGKVLLEAKGTATASDIASQRSQFLQRNGINLFVSAHFGGPLQVHLEISGNHAHQVANLVTMDQNRLENLIDIFT